ncbi:meckelin, partial [Schistosoma bovis]
LFLYSIFTTLDKILQIEDVTDDLEARPKKELRSSLPLSSISNQMEDTGISVWRIIYVANEWNEIQTYRKTSCLITIACVLILMQVIGLENLASSDAKSNVVLNSYEYQSPQSRIFRIALILSIFSVIGKSVIGLENLASSDAKSNVVLNSYEYQSPQSRIFRIALILSIFSVIGQFVCCIIQWLFSITLWERCFSDKLRSFADLCSVANVSVFLFAQSNFGYYIHGHSPTGRSDVDLGGITQMLSIENEGIAPKRGITPDSNDHTYRMALPSGLRQTFNRLYTPLLNLTLNTDKYGKHASPQAITNEVYHNINRYLKRFISRDDPDGLRYRIVRRKAFEDILDGEFDDTTFEGLFYIGKSFV